jgi:hypothetical protein
MNHNGSNIESRLWAAADELRANSKLKSSEYSVPVLGLVFLRFADHKFQAAAKDLAGSGGGRRKIGPADYQARGVLFLPTTREEKYKAKQAIDTLFMRAGDTLSALLVFVGLNLLGFGTRGFALVNLALVVLWLLLALRIGRGYARLSAAAPAES